MARMPGAEWLGPIPASNFAPGSRSPLGMTVHHMDGSFDSANGWFHNPGAGSSACYGVRLDGRIGQWLETKDFDYHACQSQWDGYFGCENESDPNRPDAPPTDAQIVSMARIAIFESVPAVAITFRGQRGVGYHRQFPGPCGQAWGQTACPGQGFIDSIPKIIAAMGTAPAPPLPDPGDEMLYKTTDNGKVTYFREARGYLVPCADVLAFVMVQAGARVVDLGGGLGAVAFNEATKKAMTKLGVSA